MNLSRARKPILSRLILMLAALLALGPACHGQTQAPPMRLLIVDISEMKAWQVDGKGQTVDWWSASTARRGAGNVVNSYRTPLGLFKGTWESHPTLGRSFRLADFCPEGIPSQRLTSRRGILLHRGEVGANRSGGCVHLTRKALGRLEEWAGNDLLVLIRE